MKINVNSPREGSIWGPHILWQPEPALFSTIAYTKWAAIKLVADDADLLYLAKLVDANPSILENTILIARPFRLASMAEAMVSAARLPTDVIAAANWLHKAIMKLRTDYPRLAEFPIYWEALNEPSREQLDKVASFDIESALLAQRDGIRRLLGGFPEGTPDIIDYPAPERPTNDDWPKYYGALKAIHEVGPDTAMLHVHEYAMGVGAIPDKSKERNELLAQPYRVGRINKVYDRHIRPHAWNIATVVSEGPLDQPNQGIEEEMKIAWLTDSDMEEMYCQEVKAVTIYTMDQNQEWKHFSFNEQADEIADHVEKYTPGGIVEVPTEPEPELPEPVGARVGVYTIHPNGQWIRQFPFIGAETVGEIDPDETGYIAEEEVHLLGQENAWVHLQIAEFFGHAAAWLLARKG